MNKPDPSSRTPPSAEARLGLERLIVGRECNGFDRLPPAQKARAFAELIRLGLVYGQVEEVAGRDFPNVSVQRVSSRGKQWQRSARRGRVTPVSGFDFRILWVFVAIAAALFGCLFLMYQASGG